MEKGNLFGQISKQTINRFSFARFLLKHQRDLLVDKYLFTFNGMPKEMHSKKHSKTKSQK